MTPGAGIFLFISVPATIVGLKSLCLTHSEAKQTETLEFGAEQGLLQGQARRMGGLHSKDLNSPIIFREEFISKIWGEGCRVCAFLLISGGEVRRCSRNLVLSLKLPSSTWVVGRTTLRRVSDCYVCPLRRN